MTTWTSTSGDGGSAFVRGLSGDPRRHVCTRHSHDSSAIKSAWVFGIVPVVAQHLPGVANIVSDTLPRWAQAMSSVTLASFLREATPVFLPVHEAAH